MRVTCPICQTHYERVDYSKYAIEDCPKCNLNEIVLMKGRKRLNQFDSYDDEVNSGNRLIAIGLVLLLIMCSLAFVSAIETKGGVFNSGFEYGTGTSTILSTFFGNENYGWGVSGANKPVILGAGFSTTQKYSGNQSLFLDANISNTNKLAVLSYGALYGGPSSSTNKHLIPIKPLTTYKLSECYYVTNRDYITMDLGPRITTYNSNLTRVSVNKTPSYNDLTLNEWDCRSQNFTTTSTEIYLMLQYQISDPTNAPARASYYLDDIRLEEVDSVSLSSQQSGRPSLTITGVTDTNAIDQSQTTAAVGTSAFGKAANVKVGQQIFPTQQKLTGITIRKGNSAGTFTGNVTFELRTTAGATPSTTILASKTLTNAEWTAITANVDYDIPLPAIVATDTNYWIVIGTDTNSETNYANLYNGNSDAYSGLYMIYNGTTWSGNYYDIYFKTHFAKLSSSVDLNVVAPDGTSELKSYDVNGDILTDANITINPDGTGRYYYSKIGTNSLNYMDISKDFFDLGYSYSITGIPLFNATPNLFATYKVTAPIGCDMNLVNFKFNLHGATGRYVNIKYSKDNINFTTLDVLETQTGSWSDYYTAQLDNQNTGYFRVDWNSGASSYMRGFQVDANLSCPGLTTPLFKQGTNTVYTMNKDADNQAGATLTPSLMSNLTFNFFAPTTTFSSSQVPNTTDQNITLTCTDDNTGCKAINYNINNTGWKDKTNHDLNYFIQNHTSYGKGITSTAFTSSVPFQFLQTISGSIGQAPGSGPEHPVYVKFNIYYRDGTTVETPTYGGLYSTNFSYTATKDYKDINYITSTTSGDNFYIQNLNADLNIYYNNPSRISFLYSGAGFHSIQYFSTDNSDNNETTKTSNFTTYGKIRFYFKDENSGSDLTGVQVNFNGVDYDSGANNYLDFNFQTLSSTNATYLFTISKSGYSTRYYQTDLNYFSSFDINFALIPNSLDSDILFKVYETDETTLFTNTYVEVKDSDTNWTIGRLKTNSTGDATFNLKADDSNYNAIVNNGEFTYTPVAVTVLYPKNEETFAQITEKWKIEITQNLYASYLDLNTSKIIYLLPNTALPYNIRISDMNGNYFPRTYAKTYPGNPLTDTLQPYLVSESTGLLTTINAISATTNQPLEGITFKVYKYISGLGRTFVEQLTTDSKGQALSLLVLGDSYEFEAYNGSVLLKNFPITATSSTIFFVLSLGSEVITQPGNSGFSSKFTPGNIINLETIGSQGFYQTLYNFGDKNITIVSTITQNGANLSAPQNYSGSSDKTFTYTVAWASIVKGTIIQKMVVTTSDGNVYVFDQNIQVIEGFGTGYNPIDGLQYGLRSDLVCSSDPLVPCYPLLVLAFLICVAVTIWATVQFGVYGGQSAGLIFLVGMILFTYLTWIPVWVTAGLVLIILAFIVNERR